MAPLPERPKFSTSPLTVAAIFMALEKSQFAGRSARLGASSWGDECLRASWYAFRYANPPKRFDGRMVRLFGTGHIQESRLVEDLQRAGFEVLPLDPSTANAKNPNGKQWEYTFLDGHAVARLDGKIRGIPEAPATWHALEIKTHNKKSFDRIEMDGVRIGKPEHYVQCQLGMHGAKLDRALYVALCKDDERIHVERIYLDPPFIAGLMAKGERVIHSATPPARLHEDPDSRAAYKCRSFCDFLNVCHQAAFAERNCRTCIHSTPARDGAGKWDCAKFGPDIPASFQRTANACPAHRFNPAFVPGDILSADAEAETVTYKLFTTGESWTDGKTEA